LTQIKACKRPGGYNGVFTFEGDMPYKEIIVYLDPFSDTENRLNCAVALAAAHGARLIGVDACSDAAFADQWRERAVDLADQFGEAIKLAGVRGAFRGAYRSAKSGRHHYAHYADLIIASQMEVEARKMIVPGIPEDVLLTAGVPLLILPAGWKPRAIGENIVIAWKSGREATRAVHDAMPLLVRARKVTAFTFAPQGDVVGREPDLLVNHLREHGVAATASSWPDAGELSAVDALFACLDTQEADLVVAGAYGHARWLEGLFGGVSHDLVNQPSLPVFMSH
jgi:nucleotide-binding universal stress UspA family protein